MTTEEVKKAIESKINEIDNLKKELTEIIFENPEIIEEGDDKRTFVEGYVGDFKVSTANKVVKFAVNSKGWVTTFDHYLMGVTEMPCIKSFIISKENEKLKNKVNELEKIIAGLQKCAN